MTEISIIIINFNTPKLLHDCLESLDAIRKAKEVDFEVLLVNVTPNDGSKDFVEKDFAWVNQIIDERNLGFSGNNNLAAPKARGKYVFFLNSDTRVPLGTLKSLMEYMDNNEKVAVVTPYVELVKDGKFDPDTVRNLPTPFSAFLHFFLKRSSKYQKAVSFDSPSEIEATAGAAMFVRKSAAEKVGWWDEDFFFYGEDLDWCYRFKEAGWKIMFYPMVKIYHYKGASSGLRVETKDVAKVSKEQKKRLANSSVDAMWIFYNKHYRNKYPFYITYLVRLGTIALKIKRLFLS